MTAAAVLDRRGYQREVASLLEQIQRWARELQRLKAAGVRGPGLAGPKRELVRVRERLASLTGARAA